LFIFLIKKKTPVVLSLEYNDHKPRELVHTLGKLHTGGLFRKGVGSCSGQGRETMTKKERAMDLNKDVSVLQNKSISFDP
jgi:hypothetical protein